MNDFTQNSKFKIHLDDVITTHEEISDDLNK